MKKVHLGLALVAVFAMSAFAATSAFAVSKILLNGAEIVANTPFQVTGELLLEDMGAAGTPDVLCSGIFDGTIEPGGVLGLIEALLTLGGAAGNLVECTEDKATCSNPVDVTVLNLPWHIEIELNGLAYLIDFLSEAGKIPTYDVDCNTIFGLVEDTCSGLSSARLFTSAGGLLGSFNSLPLAEPFGAESQAANCSVGGAGQGLIESPGDTEAAAGVITSTSGTLTLSE